ncbi:MAG: hypothetical protein ASUL_04089 [Candidatus Aramenus sulfurataquae]|jgi:hypothetical protein|uniref:Uncharacterized protein n=2 Tax=Candidatus Aramenus sulfurataquae TaxID=1326980 RepID=W7KNN8_9CREN|nr:MAG: hypothetical protein ASUL_04089 [Candidatus Aramenus sulfurataquae]MCL7344242.1 hypothetical protein [Candidatus Aramenus sulfurataquae]
MVTNTASATVPPPPVYIGYFPEIALAILLIPIVVVLLIGYNYELISFKLPERKARKVKAKKKAKT